jgi:hypothetical protein
MSGLPQKSEQNSSPLHPQIIRGLFETMSNVTLFALA